MSALNDLTTYNSLIVLLGTGLLGLACGVVGSFTVLRERALIGDCVAHAALPGICVSFLIFHDRGFATLFVGAAIAGLFSAAAVWGLRRHTRVKEDAALAIVLSSFFGLGITLSRIIQNTPSGNAAGLDTFILGKAASIAMSDVFSIATVTAIALVTTLLLFKELTLLCFDAEFARAQRLSARILDSILMVLVCLCASAGLPAVGAVLVAALLIIPAATARLWSDRIERMVPLAGLTGLASCVIGTAASVITPGDLSIPTGPLIVLTAALLFAASLAISIARRRTGARSSEAPLL